MKLDKLAKKARVAVVHLFRLFIKLRVLVVFDIPQAVGQAPASRTGHLLLLRCPIRQLDLVREQDAPGHDVYQTKFGLNSPQTLFGDVAYRLLLYDLDAKVVIGVAFKPLITIGRDLVLPLSLADRRSDIVRVQSTVGRLVVESENGAVLNGNGAIGELVPGVSAIDWVAIDAQGLSLVFEEPDVVLIFVRVQGDLLLLASSRIHERMGVQVATLSVDVTDGDATAKSDIGRNVLHAFAVQSCLELGTHEAVALAGVDEAEKVNSEHGHVEGGGNDDEAEDPRCEMLTPQPHSDILVVSQQYPELQKGQRADPGDSEQTNPFDAGSDAQTETCCGQPKPPSRLKSLVGSLLVLIRKARECKSGESGRGYQRGIEEDESSLGQQTVL